MKYCKEDVDLLTIFYRLSGGLSFLHSGDYNLVMSPAVGMRHLGEVRDMIIKDLRFHRREAVILLQVIDEELAFGKRVLSQDFALVHVFSPPVWNADMNQGSFEPTGNTVSTVL